MNRRDLLVAADRAEVYPPRQAHTFIAFEDAEYAWKAANLLEDAPELLESG